MLEMHTHILSELFYTFYFCNIVKDFYYQKYFSFERSIYLSFYKTY